MRTQSVATIFAATTICDGMVGLLTPSGIASDKTAAPFFKGVATGGRLKALYDFENRGIFFPDVHNSFKFCVFVASPSQIVDAAQCAFYLHDVNTLNDTERCFSLSAEDFSSVNPLRKLVCAWPATVGIIRFSLAGT